MRKLSILSLSVLVLFFGAGHAMAQGNYAAAIDGTKPFEGEATIDVGAQITFDVYLEAAPGVATSGGAWVNFKNFADKISYVSAGRALDDGSEGLTGPWDPNAGGISNEPLGNPGQLQIVVGQTGGVSPDAQGDIIVARVTLECTAVGDAEIVLRPIPGFGTWGPPENGYNDADILAATPKPTLVVHQVGGAECTPGETRVCDTGLMGVCADGTETCDQTGFWGDCLQDVVSSAEVCDDGLDNDCDGLTDCADDDCVGPPCTECIPEDTQMCDTGLMGECADGTETCDQTGFWGDCLQDVASSAEVCDDGLDNDCDGLTDCADDDCIAFCGECTPGETRACDTGLMGVCADGTETCDQTGFWGDCVQDVASSAEVCDDGLDNDCDGLTDCADDDCIAFCGDCTPGETQTCDTGLMGECADGTQTCDQTGFWGDCVQDVASSAEVCDDGLDNDCDGLTDCADDDCIAFCGDCTPGETRVCDTGLMGVCADGTQTCDQTGFWGDCVQDVASLAEVCDDGLDNDCDGLTDCADADCITFCGDCTPGETRACDTGLMGVCADGTQTCDQTGFWGDCVQDVVSSAEVCDDGLDNDCDGLTDCADDDCIAFCGDCTPGETRACDTGLMGVCADGTQTCDQTGFWGDCVQDVASSAEVCDDGLDNDCDGLTDCADDDCIAFCGDCTPGETRACDTGLMGVCADGTQTCDQTGFWGDCVQDVASSAEVCDDGLDNDCDGLTDCADDDCIAFCGDCTPGETRVCDTGLMGVCADGTQTCDQTGFWGDCVQDVASSAEVCDDGLDNDCDGLTDCADDDCIAFCGDCTPGETRACDTGLMGVCADGTETCDQTGFWGDCVQDVQPSTEICDDGLDNDCDGLIDGDDPDCQGTTDSDEDGLPDDIDPCPFDQDCDDDGLTDGPLNSEDLNANGRVDDFETDPTDFDTDDDGISDGVESGLAEPQTPDTDLAIFLPDLDPTTTTFPYMADSDGDGAKDGEEDLNGNGRVDEGEWDPNDENSTPPPVVEQIVSIDIKPGSCPNPLNLKTGRGVLSAAILGTDDLDVTTINPDTIMITREGIMGGVPIMRSSYKDVGTPFEGELCDCHKLEKDGYMDLSLKFMVADLVTELMLDEFGDRATIPLTIVGETYGGTPIRGEDCIVIRAKDKPRNRHQDKYENKHTNTIERQR